MWIFLQIDVPQPFFSISCFPNIIVPFIPWTTLSIHLPVAVAGLLVLLTLLEPTLYQPLQYPSPASNSPATTEALSQVDGSCHSLTEPPRPPHSSHPSLYSIHRSGEEGPNQERSLPRVIAPTHEFVAVSFVEFVFLLA